MEYSTFLVTHAVSILDPAPKTSVRLLVGREKELREIVSSVIEHRIVVVLGPRRIGKTSIVKTALSVLSGKERIEGFEPKYKIVPIYVDMWAIVSVRKSRDYFLQYICNTIAEALEKHDASLAGRFREKVLTKEEGVSKKVGTATVFHFEYSREKMLLQPASLERCLEELNNLLGEHEIRAVLAIDEAQELGLIKPFSPSMWLAHIHDHLNRVHVLLSGSYVGLLKRVLEPRPRDPLYGRDVEKIRVGKLDIESMLKIFTWGLGERGILPSIEFSRSLIWTLARIASALSIPLAVKYDEALVQEKSKEQPSNLQRGLGGLESLSSLITLSSFLIALSEFRVLEPAIIYEAARMLMKAEPDLTSFLSALPERERKAVEEFGVLLEPEGARALMLLSLFMLSGYPHLVISMVKKLPSDFGEEDLHRAALEVFDESYRAVCSEVNNFVEQYAKIPKMLPTILYSLYIRPRTTSELVKMLPDIDKKSVIENLKALVELGYIGKIEIGYNTYYYITDPLLLFALKEGCLSTIGF